MSHDIVIRNGRIVDGSGGPSFIGDLAISNGRIADIGKISESGRREIDAAGLVVSPGFIDGHTHMDAQVHWDPLGSCSCWHGVTSVVMGNCGFTLAPVRAETRELLVRNLERAEDISAAAMKQGIEWTWETFPEYMDVLDRLPKGINYAVHIGHSALRTWAMGERAFDGAATEADLQAMEGQLRAAMQAGAIGFSTSQTNNHEMSDGRPVASRLAGWDEVTRLVGAMAQTGAGIFELAPLPGWASTDSEQRNAFMERLRRLTLETGAPITLPTIPGPLPAEVWQSQLAFLERTHAEGGDIFSQSHPRGVTILLTFLGQLPFDKLPEWKALRARPLAEQKRLLRDPALRTRLVHEAHHGNYGHAIGPEARQPDWAKLYLFDQPYPPYPTVADEAARRGVDPVEAMIDLALESDFRQVFLQYLGTPPRDEDLLTILRHPLAIPTFSDTGAHVGQISDSALQTYFIAQWARRKQAFSLEQAVHMVTAVPARRWGFADRGLLQPGKVADINVFDYERLTPGMPEMLHDLPGGARRFVNKTEGIRATLVGGEVLMENGEHTGALPGKLLRGPLSKA
jgi:N-acyl-D-amino-acid deacylase